MVWQEKTGTSSYNIHFATSQNGGNTWSNTYVLSTVSSDIDPLPVIQATVTSMNSILVVYSYGISPDYFLKSYWTSNSNPSETNWYVSTVESGQSELFSPTLAGVRHYYNGSTITGLAYEGNQDDVFYRWYQHWYYNYSSPATNLSAIVPGSAVHETPSIAGVPNSSNLHVAWHRITGSGSSVYDHTIIHRKSNGFDSWPNEYSMIYYVDQQLPSITSLSGNKVYLLYQNYSQNRVWKQYYNGSYWGSPTSIAQNARFPSTSSGSTSAKYVWTSGTSSPYIVELGLETLSKTMTTDQNYYSRSIAWLDSSGAYLEVLLDQMKVKFDDGTEQFLEFIPASLDSFQITPDNSWGFLASAPTTIPTSAESLFVDFTIFVEGLNEVLDGSGEDSKIILRLSNSLGNTLGSFPCPSSLVFSTNLPGKTQRLAIPLKALPTVFMADEIQVRLDSEGLKPLPATYASLGHIYDFTGREVTNIRVHRYSAEDIAPSDFVLNGNYPNPFNPITTIKYHLPERSFVKLKIYDLMGREIRALVSSNEDAGYQSVTWDGKDSYGNPVSSGMYFYRLHAISYESDTEFLETRKMILLR